MSKRVRSIIAAAVTLAILIGVLCAVMFWPEKEDVTEGGSLSSGITSSEKTDIYGYIELITNTTNEIKTITAQNKNGGYTVTQVDKGVYSVKGAEKYSVSEDIVEDIEATCIQFTGKKVICKNPDAEQMKFYGLNDCSIATVSYTTGDFFTFYAGDFAASGDRYVYVKETDTIYTTVSGWAGIFDKSYTALLDLYVVDDVQYDEDDSPIDPNVKKISYSGPLCKKPVVVEINPDYVTSLKNEDDTDTTYNKFMYTSPIKAEINDEAFEGFDTIYYGLTAHDAYTLNASATDLATTGLNNPQLTVEITAAKRKDTILIGNTVNIDDIEYVYVKNTAKEPIFLVEADTFDFYKADVVDYMSAIVINTHINDIDTMSFEFGGKKYDFKTTGKDDELVVRYDGKKCSLEEYRDLYQLVMLAYCEESVDQGQYSGPSKLKITYTYRNREKVDTVEFFDVAIRKCLIRKNGQDLALVRSKYVDTLIFGVNEFLAGRNVPSDY